MSKILIVDDEPCILEILSHRLTEQGHQTICASSGDAAVQLLPAVNPDLVLTDIRMIPGDGFRVLMASKQHDPLVAVIMMTGHLTNSNDCAEALKLGADDYLCKPFQLSDLDRRVQYALKYRCAKQARNPKGEQSMNGESMGGRLIPACG